MREFQEHLVRAGALARLEALLLELQPPHPRVPDAHRAWFAELLHPFSDDGGPTMCSLRPSADISAAEGGAIISILLEDLNNDPSELERRVRRLQSLRSALIHAGRLDEDQASTARDIAKRLRTHFVGTSTPAGPGTDSLA